MIKQKGEEIERYLKRKKEIQIDRITYTNRNSLEKQVNGKMERQKNEQIERLLDRKINRQKD